MANDSHHFRTAAQLETEGYRREDNHFVSPFDRYLPLYEAKMLHQFDHRWATYINGETSRDVTVGEKADPHFRVQPRYWVREQLARSSLPRRPKLLAYALELPEPLRLEALQEAFAYWLTGWSKAHGQHELSERWHHLPKPVPFNNTSMDAFSRCLREVDAEDFHSSHELTEADLSVLADPSTDLEAFAQQLVDRFSPKWLMGWPTSVAHRTSATTISSAAPLVACGHTIPLMFPAYRPERRSALLIACLNSFVQDYSARQKVGGTHMVYNVFRQLAVLPPSTYDEPTAWAENVEAWLLARAIELFYTTEELRPLAEACGFDGPPFHWNEERRFQLRCELDAAYFHLYLPAEQSGDWQLADGEAPQQINELRHHFATPRLAVDYIMETFPIVKSKDKALHGHYRTKETILQIYDALSAAQRTEHPFTSPLSPAPGTTLP